MTTPLLGVGEAFGQAVDAVIRRPAPAVVPLLLDGLLFLAALVVLSVVGVDVLASPAYERVAFGFGLPAALPTLADVLNLATVTQTLGRTPLIVAAVAALLLVPVVAFVEGAFVGVLREAYIDDDQEPERPLLEVGLEAGRRHLGALFLYRLVLAVAFVVTLAAVSQGGPWANSAAGALALRWLLMFTPYAIVLDGNGFADAVRASVRTVSDHLATSLVVLLFLLLTTGGAAALLTPFVRVFGLPAAFLGIVGYAPVGTTLSTFLLLMWRYLHAFELEPEPQPAPEKMAVRA